MDQEHIDRLAAEFGEYPAQQFVTLVDAAQGIADDLDRTMAENQAIEDLVRHYRTVTEAPSWDDIHRVRAVAQAAVDSVRVARVATVVEPAGDVSARVADAPVAEPMPLAELPDDGTDGVAQGG